MSIETGDISIYTKLQKSPYFSVIAIKVKIILGRSLKLLKDHLKEHLVLLGIAAVILFTSGAGLALANQGKISFLNDLNLGGREEAEEEVFSGSTNIEQPDYSQTFVFNHSFASPILFYSNLEPPPSYGGDYVAGEEGTDSNLVLIGETALLGHLNPLTTLSSLNQRDEIIEYMVVEGDIPSVIAASFGITTHTLLWANNLKEGDFIKPGDKLIILPISGVLHKVQEGETLAGIVKKYKGDLAKAIEFNSLPTDGAIQIGDAIVIPDGVKPAPRPISSPRVYASKSPKGGHSFPYGYCTWYVAQKRYIPWGGHAKSWLWNAKQYGFKTGAIPAVGAVIITWESWYGHVGYVEAVEGNWVTFSEMNHIGWAKKSWRTLYVNDPVIRGYIY